jgi:hypothetical protein
MTCGLITRFLLSIFLTILRFASPTPESLKILARNFWLILEIIGYEKGWMMRVLRFSLLMMALFLISMRSVFAQNAMLNYGEPVRVEVTAEQNRFRYSFEGKADDQVYVSAFVPNPNMDITLNLFGPNGTQLGTATDNAIGAVLGPYVLASAGRYTVEMFQPDYNLGETGEIELIVDQAGVTSIKPDGQYSGTLPYAGAVAFFSYAGPANELFGYSASGLNIGFYMFMPSGEGFIQNYSSDGLFEPLQVLPESGEYAAFLQTSNPGGTDYTLSLTPINVVEISPDESFSGSLEANSTSILKFTSGVDELWRVDVIAPDAQFSARLDIRSVNNPFDNLLSDSGSGTDGAPRIDPFISPAAGEYYILLSGGTDFDYTLTLTRSTVVRLDNGVVQQGMISPETGTATYIYFGIAEEKVRITLESAEGQPGMTVFSPQDELVSFYARSTGKSTFEVTLPETGLYRFTLRNVGYDGAPLSFALTLENTN